MTIKWNYFLGAVVLGSYILISAGAPPVAVAVGIGAAALVTRQLSRSA